MNNTAMAFDAGTWWLVGLLATALTGAVVFLVKRTLFSRVDDLSREVGEIRDGTVKKADYDKAQEKMSGSIEEIKRDYTPRNIHEKSYDELRADIKKIMENFLTREDFFREHAKVDRKIDMLLDFEIKRKGNGI